MVVVSYSGKEINAKLVYYGAGLSGKTTNLESIYEAVPDTSRGKMVSMKTQSDRTLFFDLLPLDLGEIMGFKTRFLLYTVPGQVFYNATRKLVLKGADAIVFVADSEVGKMEENKESLANLKANLAEYGLNLDQIPWVIQYNKRDLPNVYSLDELNADLNPGGKVPFFEAVATQGKGVFETFRGISHMLMEKVTRDLRRGPASGAARGTPMPTAPSQAAANAAAASPMAPPMPAAATPAEPPRPSNPARMDNAAPNAPGRMIEQEARASQPVEQDGAGGVDYGREIELPNTVPAAGAPAHPKPAPKLEPVPVASAAPQAAPPSEYAAPFRPAAQVTPAASASPAPPMQAAPTPPAPVAPAPRPAPPEAAAAHPAAPAHRVDPRTARHEHQEPQAKPVAPPATPTPALGPTARGGPSSEASSHGIEPVVVPVRVPKGTSREIVLRIVISNEDAA